MVLKFSRNITKYVSVQHINLSWVLVQVWQKIQKFPKKIGRCEFVSENHVKFDFFHDLSKVLLFWSTDNGMIYTQLILLA